MKKVLLSILFLSFTCFFLKAEKKVHEVESKYSSVKSLMFDDESTGFLVYEHGGRRSATKKTRGQKAQINIAFTIYDSEMGVIAENNFGLTKGNKLGKVIANDKHICFEILDLQNAGLKYIFVDKEDGELVYTKSFNRKSHKDLMKHFITPGLKPKLYPAKDGFYFATYDKKHKEGYTIKKVNEKFKTIWTKRMSGGKKDLNLYARLKYQKGKLVLLNAQRPGIFSKNISYSLEMIDDESGKELYSYQLKGKNKVYMPNQVIIEDDGSVAIGGTYFEGEKIKAKVPDGLFLLKLDEDGKKDFVNITNWKTKLKAAAKKQSKEFDLFQGGLRFFCQNIIKNGDNYDMIIEMFRKDLNEGKAILLTALKIAAAASGNVTVEGNSYQIELLDFLVLSINGTNGDYADSYFIKKEKQKINLSEELVGVGSYRLLMSNPSFFCYKIGSSHDSKNPYFLYKTSKKGSNFYNIVSLNNGTPTKKTIDLKYPTLFKNAERSSFRKLEDNNLLFYTFNRKENNYTFWLEQISEDYVDEKKLQKAQVKKEEATKKFEAKNKEKNEALTKKIEELEMQLEKRMENNSEKELDDMTTEELEKELKIMELQDAITKLKSLQNKMNGDKE